MQSEVIGRRCTVCDSPARALVDGAILSGDTIQSIADTIGASANISRASLYRHRRNGHHIPRRFSSALPGEAVSDVARGLVESIEAASAIRDAAARRGADSVVLRATAEIRAASVALADRLGMSDQSVSEALAYGEELTVCFRHAALKNPELADALADAARERNRSDLAADAEDLAALARERLAQTTT